MWKIILSNMKEKKGAYFVLFVELTLLMFLAFWVFQMLIPYLQEEVYYRQNHLERYVFFSMDEYDEKALEAVAKQMDQVTMLGKVLRLPELAVVSQFRYMKSIFRILIWNMWKSWILRKWKAIRL